MRSRVVLAIVATVALLVTTFNSIYMIHDDFFYSIDDLPTGQKVTSVTSPDGNKELEIYRVKNSLGEGVRCCVTENGESKNVFWQTGRGDASVQWAADSIHVAINGETVNIETQFYDSRDVIEEIIPIVNLTKNRK